MSKRAKLLYDKGHEPAFIRRFKERTGYQAPVDVDEKRRIARHDIDDDDEQNDEFRREDEKPQVVQLASSDLSKEEVEKELKRVKEEEDERKCISTTGRLLFRRPQKKTTSVGDEPSRSTKSSSEHTIVDVASTTSKAIKRKTGLSNNQSITQHSSEQVKNIKDVGDNAEKKVSNSKSGNNQRLSFMTSIDGDEE
ncbi:unnamed protein product [Didymodactylos carnosus]|uniref:DUF4604 domain-containing protein n=1 Tax=Didymodactylos carnosus TaxID=1234261 RepID=A0A813PA69_9BILA|nr:unnamed protein product [Didymodactylos carnosus]CAF1068345.1 unnamed protein product [Didymodactylos carnosus]CAF3527287.1 unnamed protein product [Didymodactylos carnosus]CAF3833054.1 unnamed protein product [Didymodactylos carnosus]